MDPKFPFNIDRNKDIKTKDEQIKIKNVWK